MSNVSTAAERDNTANGAVVVRTDSKVDAVTVYPKSCGARVRRVAEVSLPATVAAARRGPDRERHSGSSDHNDGVDQQEEVEEEALQLFFAMPPEFDADSVQVLFDEHTSARVVLCGILFDDGGVSSGKKQKKEEEEEEETDVDIRALEKQIEEVKRNMALKEIEMKALEGEDKLNEQLFSRVMGPLTDAVEGVLEEQFWEAQLTALEERLARSLTERRRVKKEADELGMKLEKLAGELWERTGDSASQSSASLSFKKQKSVCIFLSVKEPIPKAKVYVFCVVPDLSWSAEYEASLDVLRGQVNLCYYASIQTDGESYEDVELTLSSAASRSCALVQKLEPWHLQVREIGETDMSADFTRDEVDGPVYSMRYRTRNLESQAAEPDNRAGFMNMTLPFRQTIRAGDTSLRVPLTSLQLGARVSYVATPFALESVFVQAVCTNDSEYSLLTGVVTVLARDDTIGRDCVGFVAPGQEFTLSFGVDDSVSVQRRLLRRATTTEKFSLFNREPKECVTYAYQIQLTNHKQEETVTLTLRERIPKSDDEKLVVRLLEPRSFESSGDDARRRKMEATGAVEIDVTLRPGESATVPFSFQVEAPLQRHIHGL